MKNLRVKFESGQQKSLISYTTRKLNYFSIKDLLKHNLGISYSALKSYYQERCLMSLSIFKKLCILSRITPSSLNVIYLPSNWGAVKGGKKGIWRMRKKYASKLKLWSQTGGRKSGEYNLKNINYPELNEDLAEFIGAHLGDGTMSKYFIKISGDYRYDLSYFNYLSKIVLKLFGISTSITKEKYRNTAYLTIYSKEVCLFLNKNYYIPFGDKIKNNAIIPERILKNRKLFVACLRGLVDTDGSISRRGRNGSQFCLEFFSQNKKLFDQVNGMGRQLNIFTYSTKNRAGTNKWDNIKRYFKIVGSSNLKHIIRFYTKNYENTTIYLADVPKYLKKDLYINMNLPFKMGSWSSG